MNFSFKSTGKTNGMIRETGLEADPGLQNVLLLQGFATRSLQFKIFRSSLYMTIRCSRKHNVPAPQKILCVPLNQGLNTTKKSLNFEDRHGIENEAPGHSRARIYNVIWEIPDKGDIKVPITTVIPSGSEFVNVIGEMCAMPLTE